MKITSPAGIDFCPSAVVTGETFYVDLNEILPERVWPARVSGAQVDESSQLYANNTGAIVLGGEGRDTSRMSKVEADTFYVDLDAIQAAVLQQQRDGGTQVDESSQLYADNTGEIVLGGEGRDTSRMSKVEADTFYVDLDAIKRAVLEAQRNGGTQVDESSQLYADNTGEIVLGGEGRDTSRMSKVEADTFYVRDLAAEARAVAKMPASHKVSDGTTEGYAYSITNDFRDTYELFIHYHSGYQVYRVVLVSPRLGGEVNVHGCHLWSDGTICLTKRLGSGYPSMEETYSKSVLWTLGASLFQRGYGFQFNTGQAS